MVMTVPDGASNGTLSHAEANDKAATTVRTAGNEARQRRPLRRACATICDAKDNTLMDLGGQAGQRGYAMAALLVMVSIMAIMMIALLPVWRHQAQREKEAELAFRGEQYARAIYLFRTRNNNQPPPNIDVLVQGKYLRKKYKDPVTGEDFQPSLVDSSRSSRAPGSGGPGPGSRRSGARSRHRAHPDHRRQRSEWRWSGHRPAWRGRQSPACSPSRARAKKPRSASTTTRLITTSGSSSTTRAVGAARLATAGVPGCRASDPVVAVRDPAAAVPADPAPGLAEAVGPGTRRSRPRSRSGRRGLSHSTALFMRRPASARRTE